MERLTVNDLNKACYDPWELCGMESHCTKGCHEEGGCVKGFHILKMYRKLARFEDLQEQGRILELPCVVGDTVYFIKSAFSYMSAPKEEKVRKIELLKEEMVFRTENRPYRAEDIGKTVFLSREEAEEALKRMEDGK